MSKIISEMAIFIDLIFDAEFFVVVIHNYVINYMYVSPILLVMQVYSDTCTHVYFFTLLLYTPALFYDFYHR